VSQFLINYAWLVPFLPLLGAVIAAAGGPWLRQQAHWPVIIGTALAFVVALGLLTVTGPETTTVVYDWLTLSGLHVPIECRLDGLTTMMMAMVTLVSTLVALFAVGYMAGDPGYPRFFACIGLFVFSMTGLVLSSNYLLTYVFWEGVGTCSYLLIGFWHTKPPASAAAKKAFLVNRVGDVGFAIAIFWMWTVVKDHDLNYGNVLSPENLALMPPAAVLGISLLLFWGATAKSAQVPLYVWLPDAMEGPTPVSALIHAATMVTAGVYLVARSMPMLAQVPGVQVLVAVIGCLTALLSASIALTQTDLKRVLAYSTVSQLGFMFMALGAGIGGVARLALVAAMFHLFTHAFFKALLFLGSGSVMHATGGIIDMRRFRGLRHRLPWTCWTFAVGGLALAGIPPLAGFWSKDEILVSLKEASHAAAGYGWGVAYTAIYWIAVLTAFLTAFYTGRAFFLTFFGPEKLPSPDDPEAEEEAAADAHAAHAHTDVVVSAHGSSHADPGHGADHGHDGHFGHESPPIMIYPLVLLAAGAVAVGMIFGPWTHWFEHHLERTLGFEGWVHPEHPHGYDWPTIIVGTLVGVLGIVLSGLMYANPSPIPGQLAARLQRLYRASYDKFYVDEFYDLVIIRPLRFLAAVCAFLDERLVHGLVVGTAWVPRIFGREVLAPFQNGLIQFYAAVSALGVAALLWILLLS
jgi:NADH-quinone oxidoreductase subunit L